MMTHTQVTQRVCNHVMSSYLTIYSIMRRDYNIMITCILLLRQKNSISNEINSRKTIIQNKKKIAKTQ